MTEQDLRVLIIEQDATRAQVLRSLIEPVSVQIQTADSQGAVGDIIENENFDLVVVNADQVPVSNIHPLLHMSSPHARVLAYTSAQRHRRSAAARWLEVPFDSATFLAAVSQLAVEARAARRIGQPELEPARPRLVGRSSAMKELYDVIRGVARTNATVLILGETGTGKELVARAIHDHSRRAAGAFIAINCSALPETLLESELFGHVRGSFTGAIADRRGLFEQAHGGTLFLDEISTISPAIQVKLLRVLQERVVQRVGGQEPIAADFRLLAASNADLLAEVREGRFREDLFYRLNVFPITVPPLRQREGDVPLLISHFRARFAQANEVDAPPIAPELLARLSKYEWPGNVRELENFVERTVILHGTTGRAPSELPVNEESRPERDVLRQARAHRWTLAELEREYILDVLQASDGQRKRAARVLGIDRRTLYRKLKEYGLNARYPADIDDLD